MSPRIRSKYPIDSTGLSEKLKNLRLDKDNDNDLPALPIIPFNLYGDPSLAVMPSVLVDYSVPSRGASINASGTIGGYALSTNAIQFINRGTTFEASRTPTVYNNVTATAAGLTAVWTAGANVRWRLMGCAILLSQGATTAAGPFVVTLRDVNALTGIGVTLSTGALPATTAPMVVLAIFDMKNGILAAAVNTALNVNLSNALTAGNVSVQAWGTEE